VRNEGTRIGVPAPKGEGGMNEYRKAGC
jgi:hypothetical protein